MEAAKVNKNNTTNLILMSAVLIVVIITGVILFQSRAKAPNKATYTLSDVAKHATETDCWMVIENKVYDFTSFIPEHPGGQLIISACGKEATEQFRKRPTNAEGPHPVEADAMMEPFYIGDLES